jgi:hypothetical protein
MADRTFTTTQRPDEVVLVPAVKSAVGDAAAVFVTQGDGIWRGQKATAWTPTQITDVQTLLDTTPAATPQLEAQRTVDRWPIEYRALALALIDEINVIRTELNTLRAAVSPPLTPPLPARTPAQAIAAIRNKAGTL